jgi:hypothetical protein
VNNSCCFRQINILLYGRGEIWQALQAAFSETTDITMARSILEAANVILPTGNPCEGCFDGNIKSLDIYSKMDSL